MTHHHDVAVLDRPHAATWAGIERWLTTAARAETSLYAGFPVSRDTGKPA